MGPTATTETWLPLARRASMTSLDSYSATQLADDVVLAAGAPPEAQGGGDAGLGGDVAGVEGVDVEVLARQGHRVNAAFGLAGLGANSLREGFHVGGVEFFLGVVLGETSSGHQSEHGAQHERQTHHGFSCREF